VLGTSRGDGGAMNVLQRVVDIFGMVRNKASIVTWAGSVLIVRIAEGIRLVFAVSDVLLQGVEKVEIRVFHLHYVVTSSVLVISRWFCWVMIPGAIDEKLVLVFPWWAVDDHTGPRISPNHGGACSPLIERATDVDLVPTTVPSENRREALLTERRYRRERRLGGHLHVSAGESDFSRPANL